MIWALMYCLILGWIAENPSYWAEQDTPRSLSISTDWSFLEHTFWFTNAEHVESWAAWDTETIESKANTERFSSTEFMMAGVGRALKQWKTVRYSWVFNLMVKCLLTFEQALCLSDCLVMVSEQYLRLTNTWRFFFFFIRPSEFRYKIQIPMNKHTTNTIIQ